MRVVEESSREPKAPRVSIIVVSFNTREMTLDCLRSIGMETRSEYEVIVIDNASADRSAEAVQAEFARVRMLASQSNLGFAAANNVAAKLSSAEYLLLLNPDTVVLKRAVDRLLDFAAQHPHAGIWGGRTLNEDGLLDPTSVWKRPTLWSLLCCGTGLSVLGSRTALFDPETYGCWQRDSIREVDIVTGCFLLIRRELWERLGGFDPAFFMYGEEADLCLRARRFGARPMFTPEATIIHYGGASERVRADKMVRLLKAKVLLLRRHWRPRLVPFGVAMLKAWPLTRALAWRVLALARREGATERAATWWAVWVRRGEWATST